MKYAVVSFGCRVNQADALAVEEALRARGAEAAPAREADLVVVNTCSVTATADQGARQTIRRLTRENPAARLLVTGCYATRDPAGLAALPGVWRLCSNDAKAGLVESVASELGLPAGRWTGGGDGPCGATVEPGVAGRTAYTLRVQTGCEERCSYCIIPTTRGASRSVPPETVLGEVGRAVAAGFKEVALTGVHIGSYGRDLAPPTTLVDLLWMLADVPGDLRFRLSSLEPMDCTPGVVAAIAASGRFEPHVHLPLQHASDRVLARMRRPYTLDGYRRLVDDIRGRLPHAAIGSDLIVGFPGESEAEFAANERFLPGSPLTHLHVFPYSDRPGTEASAMGDRPAGAVVRARARRLRDIGEALSARFRESQIDTVRPGLTLDDGTLVVTDNYLKVRIPPGLPRNLRVRVRLADSGGALAGTVVA